MLSRPIGWRKFLIGRKIGMENEVIVMKKIIIAVALMLMAGCDGNEKTSTCEREIPMMAYCEGITCDVYSDMLTNDSTTEDYLVWSAWYDDYIQTDDATETYDHAEFCTYNDTVIEIEDRAELEDCVFVGGWTEIVTTEH